MGSSTLLQEEPLYVSTCACGQVEMELRGEPIYCHLCYCQDCTTAANFVDEKAVENKHKSIASCQEGEKAAKAYLFYIEHMKVTKGEDKFEIWKLKPKGLVTRSYTTCCSTAILNACGKWPMNFRPVNAHTVKHATTGQPLILSPVRVMTKNANKEHVEAAPKSIPTYTLATWTLMWTFMTRAFFKFLFPGEGALAKKPVAWINGDGKDVNKVIPFEAYHRMGHHLNKPVPKKVE